MANLLPGASLGLSGGYAGLYDQGTSLAQGYGQSQLRDINAAYDQAWGQQRQSLNDRGLSNTTISDSVQQGNEFNRQRSLADQGQRNSQYLLGTANQLGEYGLGAQQQESQFGRSYGLQANAQANQARQYQQGLAEQESQFARSYGLSAQQLDLQKQQQQFAQQQALRQAYGSGGFSGVQPSSGGSAGSKPNSILRPFAQDYAGGGSTGAGNLSVSYGAGIPSYPTAGSGASGSANGNAGSVFDGGTYSSAYPVGDFPSAGDFAGVA